MTFPNTLIFADLISDDPAATGAFYEAVLGWTNEGRPEGLFHRLVPGGNMRNPDGSDSALGNLHLGISHSANARPHPAAEGMGARVLPGPEIHRPRLWVLVSDEDSVERILAEAEARGAEILWRDHYWAEFNGFNEAFRDPWGNEIILWRKGGPDPVIGPDTTRE